MNQIKDNGKDTLRQLLRSLKGRGWGLVFFLLFPLFSQAQVIFEARLDTMIMLIGEQRELTLDLTCDAQQKARKPQLQAGQLIANVVEVVERLGSDTIDINDGKRKQVVDRYSITAWDSAFVLIPPFEAEVNGEKYQSKGLALKVLMVPVDTLHTDQFYPNKDIQNNPFSWDDWRPVIWFVVVNQLLALLLLWLYGHWRENKPLIQLIRRKRKLPAHQVAMNEIERIKSERKWTEEDSKEYYTELTETLRNYIHERYGFNAMEMTSGEIIERLLQEQDEEALRELRSLFQTADLVKFAKYSTMINENDANLVCAIDFINQTKLEEDPNAPQEEIIVPEEVKQSQARSLTMKIVMGACAVLAFAMAIAALYFTIDLIR